MDAILLLILAVMAVAALVISFRIHSKSEDLAGEVQFLQKAVQELTQRLWKVERQLAAHPEPIVPVPQQQTPATRGPVVMSASPQTERPFAAAPAPPRVPPAEPKPPGPRPAVPTPPQRPTAKTPFDWENLVGVKLFSWIAGIALALAAVFFLRYSIAAGWLQPSVRMAIGIIVSLALLGMCELKAARKYPVTANALDAAAIAILFATFFAGHSLWHLIDSLPAFILMAAVTALAVLLSIRRDSVFIALLGLLGGFSTPALLSTGENRPISLFGYLLILNAGLAWVAHKKKWPLLTAISVVFTTIYQWVWVATFLTDGQLPTSVGIFLIFPILSFVFVFRKGTGGDPLFSRSANASAILPLAFALYMATVHAYGIHFGILFGFLLVLDAGLFVIAAARGQSALHAAGALATVLVCAIWLQTSYESAAWPAVLVFIVLFVLLYLTAPLIARRFGRELAGPAARAQLAAPFLLFAFPAIAAVEPRCAEPWLLFGVLLILMAAIWTVSVLLENVIGYLIAAVIVVVAETVWSSLHLDVDRLASGLTIYAVFGVFLAAAPLLADRPHGKLGGIWDYASFLGLTAHAFLFGLVSQPKLSVPPWAWLAVLAIVDLAVAAVAVYKRRGAVLVGAIAASDLILIMWVVTAAGPPWPSVALSVAGILGAFGIACLLSTWRAEIREAHFTTAAVVGIVMAQVVAIVAAAQHGSPGLGFLIVAHLLFIAALLAVSWYRQWHFLALVAVGPAALASWLWQSDHSRPGFWGQAFVFALAVYLAFIIYPLILGRRAGRLLEPYLAAVIASGVFFFLGRHELLTGGFRDVIGVLPVGQAVIMAILLLQLFRIEPTAARNVGRLALVAGAVFAFVTVAIPVQLEKQWITIGWALEGAALAWLYRKIPHRGLLLAATGLMTAVFIRLALNPSVLVYAPRGTYRIWNWYLYTYLVPAAALILAGWFFFRTRDHLVGNTLRASALLPAGGVVLLFYLVNIEIADFYSIGESITFNFSANIAQDLTYTLGWALFALLLLAGGIAIRSRPARLAALILLAATVLKCFLHDLGRLGGLYVVGSFVGLAVCLAVVALLLQKFVLSER